MWRVYLLRCSDGTLYCGVALNAAERLRRHNAGRGSKYVRSRRPAVLVYVQVVGGRGDALRREAEIKRMTRAQKLALVAAGGS
jgi:putative endonuclease